jgi:hypothetical protein
MGGSPAKVIKKVIEAPVKIISGGGSKPPATSPVEDRRAEVAKETEPAAKKVVRTMKRSTRTSRKRRVGGSLVGGELAGGSTETSYSPIRNPRDTGSKLGSA